MQNTLVAPVGVLGFGVEGQSTFNYLVRNGIKDIVIMDKNPVELPEVPAGMLTAAKLPFSVSCLIVIS